MAVVAVLTATGPARAADLKGLVRAGAEFKAPPALTVAVDAWACGHGGEIADPRLIIDANRGIANVVVTVVSIEGAPVFPNEGSVVIDQRGCAFVPHVVVVAPGQEVQVTNSDGVFHNFRTRATANKTVNRAQSKGVVVRTRFRQPEIVRVECDVHYWMSAVVVVAPHAHVAISGADGSFSIPDLPPGSHRLELWHERLGVSKLTVEVGEGAAPVDFLWE